MCSSFSRKLWGTFRREECQAPTLLKSWQPHLHPIIAATSLPLISAETSNWQKLQVCQSRASEFWGVLRIRAGDLSPPLFASGSPSRHKLFAQLTLYQLVSSTDSRFLECAATWLSHTSRILNTSEGMHQIIYLGSIEST